MQLTFFAASELVITGTNPEMADVVNPRGNIYGESWSVYAENAHGDRRQFWVGTNEKERAERLALALTARMAGGKLPVAFHQWTEARPAYGSPAYIAYGQADDVALEAREEYDSVY
jgi:hypothetical protein